MSDTTFVIIIHGDRIVNEAMDNAVTDVTNGRCSEKSVVISNSILGGDDYMRCTWSNDSKDSDD